jgi:hypothetical protein
MIVDLPLCIKPSKLGVEGAFWPTAGVAAVCTGGGDINDDSSLCQVIARFNVCEIEVTTVRSFRDYMSCCRTCL